MKLTPEQIESSADAYRHWLEGGDVQHVHYDDIITTYYNGVDTPPSWNYTKGYFRRKPAPEFRDWTVEDVTPGMFFKRDGFDYAYSIAVIQDNGIQLAGAGGFYTWEELAKHWLNSTDLRTWQPCRKEVK